jgi:hypothetical protein
VWDLLASFNRTNLVDGLNIGGKTTMDAEDLAFNNGPERKIIE